ncbi:wound-induced protein 1-like [Canna indica]|uniref:Wound-induced protein 1-like n=1 Tax=Canna indica TaxID=4628 RepID=A0AAQ3K466_9LILI|nr:wound-induced protein 1-like [Canna indica]
MAAAGKALVESLYASLARGDMPSVAAVLAEDVEWWFHGPRRCEYMRRLLTGEAGQRDFRFRPRTVTQIGGWVVAEGWEGKHAYWVHAWAVDAAAGVITRFREYFNTSVTVREFGGDGDGGGGASPPSEAALWQSKVRACVRGRSLPELVLAI